MRVLIGLEASGVIRRAFRARGHEAYSCDLKPAEDGSPYHFQGDIRSFLLQAGANFDLFIAHPMCTYLTASAEWAYGDGPYHMALSPDTLVGADRCLARVEAARFFMDMWNAPGIPLVAVENPTGAMSRLFREPDQIVQPYWFGDDASKATCLWLKGLPRLWPTNPVSPRLVDGLPRWGNQTDSGQNRLSPGEDRWVERSRTYPGMAAAMADIWGTVDVARARQLGFLEPQPLF